MTGRQPGPPVQYVWSPSVVMATRPWRTSKTPRISRPGQNGGWESLDRRSHCAPSVEVHIGVAVVAPEGSDSSAMYPPRHCTTDRTSLSVSAGSSRRQVIAVQAAACGGGAGVTNVPRPGNAGVRSPATDGAGASGMPVGLSAGEAKAALAFEGAGVRATDAAGPPHGLAIATPMNPTTTTAIRVRVRLPRWPFTSAGPWKDVGSLTTAYTPGGIGSVRSLIPASRWLTGSAPEPPGRSLPARHDLRLAGGGGSRQGVAPTLPAGCVRPRPPGSAGRVIAGSSEALRAEPA